LCNNFGSQPGNASQLPPPGGGHEQYCAKLDAAGKLLIPANVSTGDVIDLISAEGAGNDGGSTQWNCPDGSIFFAGRCAGGAGTSGGDPLPTANHMSLIVGIGTNYYAIDVGSPLTVPGGVSNEQAWIQVNDSGLSNNSGSYDVCVKV